MRKTSILFMACAALLLAGTVHAQSIYSDTYVIPIAGHNTGAFGSVFMTDIAITNFQNDPLTVQIIVIETGENTTDNVFPLTTDSVNGSVVVPPKSTVLLRDVLNNYRGMANATGALLLGADQPFAATSRTYNAKNGGVGDTVAPARDFLVSGSDKTAIAYITGLTSNASFRSNIGFVAANTSTDPLVIEVRVRDASGNSLGTRLITVPPGNFTQTQFPVSAISSTPFDVGSAEIRIVGGSGAVVPYATVNDNATGSAAFIMGQFPSSGTLGGSSLGSNVFRDLIVRMSSSTR